VLAERRIAIDARPLRWAGAGVLAFAALRPYVGDGDLGAPCPLRSLTGVPCPLCGMTRGVTAAVRGDVLDAVVLNPASVLLVLATVLLLVLWRVPRLTVPLWLPIAGIATLWTYELFKLGAGLPL
jgi:Protein of unknown function (DUF2752)